MIRHKTKPLGNVSKIKAGSCLAAFGIVFAGQWVRSSQSPQRDAPHRLPDSG